ncbi:PGF-pre-PGF domain-containing protein, partial [Methanosarcina sp. MSH10X1]|uniref:PGF-pre-PGF domain-containing protein n=1 Tax=Methanosarcina sp. MSH10X1 TaxID=2507075 RepID=UPI000FFB17B2
WLEDKDIDRNSIILNRYSDKKWSQLPAKLLKEDSKYLYFTAETPGFTHFAVTGKSVEKTSAETNTDDTQDLEQNNTTVADTEQKQSTEQGTGKGKISSIPGFEGLYVVVCLITVFLYKRK